MDSHVSSRFLYFDNIMKQCVKFQQAPSINFINFKKAFDNVQRESLWNTARMYAIPQKSITNTVPSCGDFIMQKAVGGSDLALQWREKMQLTDLNFANDIFFVAEMRDELQELKSNLEKTATRVDLGISIAKFKSCIFVMYPRYNPSLC